MAKANILIVDDRADELKNRIALFRKLRESVIVVSPDEVSFKMLDNADLVLVDYVLDDWATNAHEPELSRKVPNGIALIAILQQHATACARPTAFAIYSEELGRLTAPYEPEPRVHLLARTFNLEWAFLKSAKGTETTLTKAHIIADAVLKLPKAWPKGDPEKSRRIARSLLAIPNGTDWTDQAWRDAERAHPPVDEMTLQIHGILFLRWLLTRVLYYPCFLVDRYWLAARLGATPESVNSALDAKLGKILEKTLFSGILHGLPGRRWWRAGIESILLDFGDGEPLGTDELHRRLREKTKFSLAPTPDPYPVVCLDPNYAPFPSLYAAQETVRLQLDDWPSHADIPRTTIEQAKEDSRIGGLVIASDQSRLQ